MLNLGKKHMSIALKDFVKKFMLGGSEYKFLKNKAHDVEQDSIRVWKETFGVLTPTIEERESQDAIELEDDYKKEVTKLIVEIEELVSGYELKETIRIEDDTNTPLPNLNILTKEEIKILIKDARKLCTNPILL